MALLTVGREGSADVDLYYEDHGSGSPVVLIHGWPLSGRSWENQVPALVEAGHRVITYDRRGFGKSSQPWTGYDYDTFAADLDVLLTSLDLSDVTLVGFSMGGGEVVRYLSRYGSARVSRAVLAAAVPPYLYKSEDNPDGAVDDALAAAFAAGITGDRIAFLDGFLKNFFSPGKKLLGGGSLVSDEFRTYMLAIASGASPKGTLDCTVAFSTTDFRSEVSAITVPTLVIHGDSDQIVPLEASGQRSAQMITGSQLVVVEGAPHGLNATHPEQFNAALLGFLGH